MITKLDKYNNAIDLTIILAIEELSKENCVDTTDFLPIFLSSRTAHVLYDESTKLWWDGPSAIAQMYRDEMAEKEQGNTVTTCD